MTAADNRYDVWEGGSGGGEERGVLREGGSEGEGRDTLGSVYHWEDE